MKQDLAGTGAVPPITHLTGMKMAAAEPGEVQFSMPASPWLVSSRGEISSTAISFLSDAPMGASVISLLGPMTAIPTAELSLVYLQAAAPHSRALIARANSLGDDGRSAAATVEIHDDAGGHLAHGTTRVMLHTIPQGTTPRSDLPVGNPASEDPYTRTVLGEPIPPDVWATRSGLEVLSRQIKGSLPMPPIASLLGIRLVEATEGTVGAQLLVSGWSASPAGTVYGGLVTAAMDSVVAAAAQTVTEPGGRERMLDLKVNFLRPLQPDGAILPAAGRLIHQGRRIVIGEAELLDTEGRRAARAIGTVRIDPPERA